MGKWFILLSLLLLAGAGGLAQAVAQDGTAQTTKTDTGPKEKKEVSQEKTSPGDASFPWLVVFGGMIGGLLPDLLRFWQFFRTPPAERGPFPYQDKLQLVGLVLQILLGGFAAWYLGGVDLRQAIPIGYAGPALLTKAFAAATGAHPAKPTPTAAEASAMEITKKTKAELALARLLGWWSM